MTIPTAYRIGFNLFQIDEETLAARSDVWAILGPAMNEIIDRHFELLFKHAPFFIALIKKNGPTYKERTVRHTKRLFCGPLNEEWVADTQERAKNETELGHDIRSRPGMNAYILQ